MSYVQLLIHAVIRTHKSEPALPTDEKITFLYREMWGIIHNKKGYLYRINSMPDHVHVLFTIPPTTALSDFMQALKGSSSKILKTVEGFEKFRAWGEGYAALSKSMEDKDKIIRYIINQQEHHRKVTFREEYEAFVKEMGLVWDVRDWDR
jgi:REP element-mobilizing transposase RayT